MDIDGKLIFTAPADDSGRLVFGEQGGGEVIPDAVFTVDGDLPGLGTLTLRAGSRLSIDADLPGLDGTIGLAWDANVSRGMRAEVQTCWQDARPIAAGHAAAWQVGQPALSPRTSPVAGSMCKNTAPSKMPALKPSSSARARWDSSRTSGRKLPIRDMKMTVGRYKLRDAMPFTNR